MSRHLPTTLSATRRTRTSACIPAVISLVVLCAAAGPAGAQTGIIRTVAGTGVEGFSGDGGPATAAQFKELYGIAVDAVGNVFVVDTWNYRVRRVDAATGTITTYAGTGIEGFNGDGGPATAAALNAPQGAAVDAAGNLFIADTRNCRIRRVDAATGVITTVAGTGAAGFGGDGGPATAAQLQYPWGLAVSGSGDLFIADYSNQRIRKVDAATGVITTVAGVGTQGYSGDGGPATAAQFYFPSDVSADAGGNLFIADLYNYRIRRVDAATGTITTVAGNGTLGTGGDGGPATAAPLFNAYGIAVDNGGNLWIADSNANRVRFVPAATGIISTVAGTGDWEDFGDGGPATAAALRTPVDVALDASGALYIGQVYFRVRAVDSKLLPAITWSAPAAITAGSPLTGAQLNATASVPGAFAYDPPAGTVLPAGAGQTLSATFTPDDTDTYASVVTTVTIDVNPAGPVNGPPYTLTVTPPAGGTIQGAGINCGAGGAACSVTMPAAMTLGLAAVPSTGYTFANWTGDCTGTTTGLWLPLAGPRSCSAVFTAIVVTYRLTVSPVPAGGTITGGGLACGSGGGACEATFGSATTVPLTAAPDPGYLFAGWGGACSGTGTGASVVVNGVTTCSATFTASGGGASGPPYTLTITPPAGGVVKGAGIDCGAGATLCAVTMPGAMKVGLTAAASTGYSFTAWTGDCTGTSTIQWVTLLGPRTCGATFTATGGGGGGGGGAPTGGIISTIAGNGVQGYDGDGLSALAAALNHPHDAAADAAGNVYIADFDNHVVRKVAAGTGVISTVAGTAVLGFGGDDGPATAAQLNFPTGVAVDGAGNLYIADSFNHRIRMVSAATGVITTVAGGGSGGDGGPATAAEVHQPYAMAFDPAGNLIIAEQGRQVRKVAAATGIITTMAGTGVWGFSGDGGPATAADMGPLYGVAVDSAGNVYVSDLYNHRVRKIAASTGIITTVAGDGTGGYSGDGGPAAAARVNYPLGLATDSLGNLYVGDHGNARVRMIATGTGVITTVAGTGVYGFSGDGGQATAAAMQAPYGVKVDASGNLFVADSYNARIRKVGAGTAPPADGPPYTLTITTPTGGTIMGAGIKCGTGGSLCEAKMPGPMTIGLSAVPAAGYTFGGWTGHCSGASPSLWLDLKGPRTCSAVFDPL